MTLSWTLYLQWDIYRLAVNRHFIFGPHTSLLHLTEVMVDWRLGTRTVRWRDLDSINVYSLRFCSRLRDSKKGWESQRQHSRYLYSNTVRTSQGKNEDQKGTLQGVEIYLLNNQRGRVEAGFDSSKRIFTERFGEESSSSRYSDDEGKGEPSGGPSSP